MKESVKRKRRAMSAWAMKQKEMRKRETRKRETNLLHLPLIELFERVVAGSEDREADEDVEFERGGMGEVGV